jgi:hypothetical protein
MAEFIITSTGMAKKSMYFKQNKNHEQIINFATNFKLLKKLPNTKITLSSKLDFEAPETIRNGCEL